MSETNNRLAQLGDLVKCRVTGFTGIVHGLTHWLNGCVRCEVQPRGLDKDGAIQKSTSFDQVQLDVVEAGVVPAVVMAPHILVPAPALRPHGGPDDRPVSRGY